MTNETQKECQMEQEAIIFNLKRGLDAEYRAMEACENLLPLLDDAEEKEKISGIIADEEKHIKITERLIKVTEEYYSKP